MLICELFTQKPPESGLDWPWRGFEQPHSISPLRPFSSDSHPACRACSSTDTGCSATLGPHPTPGPPNALGGGAPPCLGNFPPYHPSSSGLLPNHATQENHLDKSTSSATSAKANVLIWLELLRWKILQSYPVMTVRELWCCLSFQVREEPGFPSQSWAPFLPCPTPQPRASGLAEPSMASVAWQEPRGQGQEPEDRDKLGEEEMPNTGPASQGSKAPSASHRS